MWCLGPIYVDLRGRAVAQHLCPCLPHHFRQGLCMRASASWVKPKPWMVQTLDGSYELQSILLVGGHGYDIRSFSRGHDIVPILESYVHP